MLHFASNKMALNLAKAVVLTGLMAVAAPLKAQGECENLPQVLTESSDRAQIHCALSRSHSQSSSRAVTIVEVDPEIEPVRFAINFEFGSSEITPASRALLATVAEVIAADESLRTAAYFVDGHTDAVGSSDANQTLGLARAQAAAGQLLSGVDFAMTLKVRSFGETVLLDPDNPKSGGNRRVEITPVAME